MGFKIIEQEAIKLRKIRNRLLSKRQTYIKRSEGSVMSIDLKFEWSFMYVLEKLANSNEDLFDTYKRIGNLYNDVGKVLSWNTSVNLDKAHHRELVDAYNKFLSKLKKIEYKNLVDLQKEILLHICKDKLYYGINMYRFERQLRLFTIRNEIGYLLKAKDDEEERYFIKKSIILNDLHFPKLYNDFSAFNEIDTVLSYMQQFSSLKSCVIGPSCLILDKLIELNIFGQNWEQLFLDNINNLTEKVFYNPDKIDYNVIISSQEKFEKILKAPVEFMIHQIAKMFKEEI
ncbi:regulator of replication initiation timing [Pectinatus brassicae]|uniref:Regulator of replication initiation timing n=2 Tax=Pectinatus brassicae TaxID=862415 RepID=A0A840UN07_9FIRM|nr:hypothetical protein [Pectinatus brassicae]MBB5335622.1 regulator of replication initiation timing [Pectinatus brassicae]